MLLLRNHYELCNGVPGISAEAFAAGGDGDITQKNTAAP